MNHTNKSLARGSLRLATLKTSQNLRPLVVTVAITLSLWLGSKWYFNDWFENPYKYPAKLASLSATVLFCVLCFLPVIAPLRTISVGLTRSTRFINDSVKLLSG